MKTATATCPDCRRSQSYTYEHGNTLEMIRTAAVALETMPHALDCPRYARNRKARGDASQLQASLL